jgi:hypothetical protein
MKKASIGVLFVSLLIGALFIGAQTGNIYVPFTYSIVFGNPGEPNSPELKRTGDSELSVIGADLLTPSGAVYAGFVTDVLLCGEQANDGTIYMSPVTGYASGQFYVDAATLLYNQGGTGCNAQDAAAEADADEPMFANNAFKVLGMSCSVSSSGSNGVLLNLRSATANLTPDVTITIATTDTTGVSAVVTTTDIAAAATFALRVINTENLSAEDAWCIAKILVIP